MTAREQGKTVKTTETVFRIVEALSVHDGIRITALANELEMSKSTVYRHLTTLRELGYVDRVGDDYLLGLRFLLLGEEARNRRKEYALVKEKVESLAHETGERVQFAVEEHGQAVHVFRDTGENAVKTDWKLGERVGLHETACGKAILANLDGGRIDDIIERRGLPPSTENTITDEDMLKEDLQKVRDMGYALNREENTSGLYAVGVPVFDDDGNVLGSLSVSGPVHRMKGDEFTEDIANLLLGVSNEIEVNCQFL